MFAEDLAAHGALVAWLAFIACLLLILFSGTRLSRYGDTIAVRTGLGGTWVGVLLMATVTSLPELITGLSAILVVDAPDLAVGNALGSCIYNLLIIAVLDFVYRSGSIYRQMHQGHSVAAGYGVMLLGAVAAAIFLQNHFAVIRIGIVGPYTIVTPLLYVVAMRSVFFYERRERAAYTAERTKAIEAVGEEPRAISMAAIYTRYGIHATIIVAAGVALPIVGEALSVTMGWQETFVGTILMALATSVPEIVISVQAVRIGAVDLAIGNVLGSNLFDLLIIAAIDVVYVDGPVLAATSHQNLFTAIAAATMTGVAIVALCYRPETKVFRVVGWFSIALLVVGLLNALALLLLS